MKAFLTPLQGLAEFEQIKEKSKTNKGILQVSGCMESQKSHLMYGLSGIAPYRLILAEDERRAREIYEDYRFYDRKVYSYPAKDLLFFQADIHGNLLIRQRMKPFSIVQILWINLIKLFKYRMAGVREYWIINPLKGIVNVYDFENESGTGLYSFDDEIPVCIYPDLSIVISELL